MSRLTLPLLKVKKKKLDEVIDSNKLPEISSVSTPDVVLKVPTKKEKDSFYKELSQAGTKPAILSLIPGYSSSYVPKTFLPEFPLPLTALYDPNCLKLSFDELLKKCDSIEIVLTSDMVELVEKETREQVKSKLWYKYRSGRITAFKMKSACRTDPAQPSQSLIKQICYPQSLTFRSKPTDWGCKHEASTVSRYETQMKALHADFKVANSGLILNGQWPFFGATPDSKI